MCLLSISVMAGFALIVSGIEQYIDFCSSVAHVEGSSLVFDGSDAAINSGGTFPSGTSYCTCIVQAGSLGVGVVEFTHTTDGLYAPSSTECGKAITMTSSSTSKSTLFGCASSTDFRRKDVISESTITLNMSITAPRPRDETYKLKINPGPFTPATSGFTATCTPAEIPHTTTSLSSTKTSVASPITTGQTNTASRSVETSPSTTFTPTMPSSTPMSEETGTPVPTSSILHSSTTKSPLSASSSEITTTFSSTVTTLHLDMTSATHSSTTLVSMSSTVKHILTSLEGNHSESEQPSISSSPELDLSSSSQPINSTNMPLHFETSAMPKPTSTSSTTVSEAKISRAVIIAVSSGSAVALILIIVIICSAFVVCKRRRVKRENEIREEENIYQNIQMTRPSEQRSSYSAISQPYDSIGQLYWSFEDVHMEPPPANGVSTFKADEQLNNDNANRGSITDSRESGINSKKEYSDSGYSDGSSRAKDMTYDPGYLVPLSRSVAPIVSRRNSTQASDYIYPLPDYPS